MTALQEEVMRQEQCDWIFTEQMVQKRFDQPEFLRMLDMAQPGDIVVVWRLDRLGKSLTHLIETITILEERGIELRSLKENIDTTTPTGKLLFHMVGVMAESERDIIRERTQAGLEAARARGKKGGRPKVLTNTKAAHTKELYKNRQDSSAAEISKSLGISRATLYRYVRGNGKTT